MYFRMFSFSDLYSYRTYISATYFVIYQHKIDLLWPSFFAVALRPNPGHGLLILEISRSHTTTYHSP